MLDILENNVDELGLTASSEVLENTKVRALDLLQNQSTRISVNNVQLQGSNLAARVSVENLAGHKFPLGFPSRQLWIHYTVTDRNKEIIFESGKPLASGAITGNDKDETPGGYEPHYAEITDPGQVQIYESILQDTDNHVSIHRGRSLSGARIR